MRVCVTNTVDGAHLRKTSMVFFSSSVRVDAAVGSDGGVALADAMGCGGGGCAGCAFGLQVTAIVTRTIDHGRMRLDRASRRTRFMHPIYSGARRPLPLVRPHPLRGRGTAY